MLCTRCSDIIEQWLPVDLICMLSDNCARNDSCTLMLQVIERAVLHIQNCYKVPNVRVVGHICKTNIQSNTAFRGFGGPQGMFVCETYMTAIAEKLGVEPEKVSCNIITGKIIVEK